MLYRAHQSADRMPVGAQVTRLALAVGCLVIAVLALAACPAGAATTPSVDLGSSAAYAVLSGASVGNTVSAGGAPHTILRGGLAVKANTQPLGFPPGIVTGPVDVGNAAADAADADATAAYAEIAARTTGVPLAGALAGVTVGPGLYTITGAVSNTTTVTLDAGGDANAFFVFQVGGALAMAAGSQVVLAHGAQASHVFWQVNGAGAVGANSSFTGTMIALNAVAIGNGSIVNGRAFALTGALTLDANAFYSSPPLVTIDGGADAFTTDTTPTISGTTDVEAPAVVTVDVGGQTLAATPSGGAWSITSAMLVNASYPVVASVTDGASNHSSATQTLTVDTVPPIVTLDGSPSVTTNDPTPTIGGTSDLPAGALVQVQVGTHALTALVQLDGTWNITPAALSDGTLSVTADVVDLAGNHGTASELLTIDTIAPPVTIAGGAQALTNDAAPTIAGTAAVTPGTIVTVMLADQTLTGLVQIDGSWSVGSAALVDGPHRVIVDVSDAAGNRSTLIQTLTVDTVSPTVTIDGGASATTSNLTPTITGSCNAAPGTIVTVSIAGQTMTTLLQANGNWNATPAPVGEGVWTVSVTVPDPAGNVGRVAQTLTVASQLAGARGEASLPAIPLAPVIVAPRAPAAPILPSSPSTPGGGDSHEALAKATIARDGTQKLKGLSLSIGTRVTAHGGSRLVVSASGRVKIAGVSGTTRLTTQKHVLAAGHSATLVNRPRGSSRAAHALVMRLRAAIRTGSKVRVTLTIRLADTAGHTRIVKRLVQLT